MPFYGWETRDTRLYRIVSTYSWAQGTLLCGGLNGKEIPNRGDICIYTADSLSCPVEINTGEGNGTPLQYSCLENPMDRGAWWAAVPGVAKSRTRLSDFTFTFHFPELEKEIATHSSDLAWRIPGTGDPGGLPSLGLHRVRHDWSDLAAAAAAEINTAL